MDDHLDGNGIAGLLTELLAGEPTTVMRTCQACGDRWPLGAHRAYRGAGIVLRCPSCGQVAARIAVEGDRLIADWHGKYESPRAAEA